MPEARRKHARTTLETRAGAGVLLLALAAGSGCGAHRGGPGTFHDPSMDFAMVQSVAVMPFANLTQSQNAADRVRENFMTLLQASGSLYVIPPGEVGRGISRTQVANAMAPTPEEVVAFAKVVKADAVITGSVLEYGEVRSGSTSANLISVSVKMMEAQSGKVVWSASSTKGGIKASDRLFGGGGKPMNSVTVEAIDDLLDKLFSK